MNICIIFDILGFHDDEGVRSGCFREIITLGETTKFFTKSAFPCIT